MSEVNSSTLGFAEPWIGPLDYELVESAYAELVDVRTKLVEVVEQRRSILQDVDANWRKSAANLVHYVALRNEDRRNLQRRLARLGLSSLGRSEAHVLASVDAVLRMLALAMSTGHAARVTTSSFSSGDAEDPRKKPGHPPHPGPEPARIVGFDEGPSLLESHTDAFFGAPRRDRGVRIMVTMPTEAAHDPALVEALVGAGLDCARINCAHDGPAEWIAMARNVRAAAAKQGVACTVEFELAGPKIRTGPLPEGVPGVVVRTGDIVRITREPAKPGEEPHLCCPMAQVFETARPGDQMLFDDARVASTIESVGADGITTRITRADDAGTRIANDKGINLPDTKLSIPALGSGDLAALDVAAEHADIVGLSFVRFPDDITALLGELEARKVAPAILLKIETRQGLENLPILILTAMQRPNIAVMIARGDLAVECGFEALAEIQEEILWICEAAHVPVVWATQVLESLAKKGLPTRGEITDAAMAQRAECVMLNKGPHIVEAVRSLADILERMKDHQTKKTSMLRRLELRDNIP